MDISGQYGTGKRKTAVARIYLRPGTGKMDVNRRPVENYFTTEALRMIIRQPLVLTETVEKVDVHCFVRGGGMAGQAGAVSHGISRALLRMDGELRKKLKAAGFLTRDSRIKERKKYGQRGARARFQFSKR